MVRQRDTSVGVDHGVEMARPCHDLRQYVAAGTMLAGMLEVVGLDAETKPRLNSIVHVFLGILSTLCVYWQLEDAAIQAERGALSDKRPSGRQG